MDDIYEDAERILEENPGLAEAAEEAGQSPEDAALEMALVIGWDCQNCGTYNGRDPVNAGTRSVCQGCGYRGGQPLGRPRKIPVADRPDQFPVPPEKRVPAPGGGWVPAEEVGT